MTQARSGRSVIGMTTLRMQGRAGVEANARLTAMTGIVLLALFIAEIATVLLGARSVLTLHVTLGLLLVPPVLLKIASTAWRMAGYYRGNAAYREKRPPALALRILGPFLVFLTMLLFVSGIGLSVGPPPPARQLPHRAQSQLLSLARRSRDPRRRALEKRRSRGKEPRATHTDPNERSGLQPAYVCSSL